MHPSGSRVFAIRTSRLLLGLSLACPWLAEAAFVTCNAGTVTALNNCFTTADANPANQYDVVLTNNATPYMLTKTLKLTQGTVYLRSSTGDLNNAHTYILDGGYPGASWKRVIEVSKGAGTYTPYLSISGVTVRNGIADDSYGGGIYVNNGNVNVSNSYIEKNRSTRLGAGLYIQGTGEAYVYNSIIRDNIILYANPELPQQNLCGGQMASGGGLAVWTGSLQVYKSTVTGNYACRGGGIAAYPGSYLTVENSTVSGNNANVSGGGVILYGRVGANIAFNTIVHNKAGIRPTGGSGYWDEKYGGGIAFTSWEGELRARGNILAKNETVTSNKSTLFYHGHDCYDRGPFLSANRYVAVEDNFIGAMANCSLFGSNNWWDIGSEGAPEDPQLDPLSVKIGASGPQYTHAPKPTSPVIGSFWAAAGAWGCVYDDQLGHRRDWYSPESFDPRRCDRGAHQFNWFH